MAKRKSNDTAGYEVLFQGCSGNKTPATAQASVDRIDQIYRYFKFIGDSEGQAACFTVAARMMITSEQQARPEQTALFRGWMVKVLEEKAEPEKAVGQ